MYELVEGAWDAVEADRLESDFAHKGRVLNRGGLVGRDEVVEEGKRGGRVDGHCRGCLQEVSGQAAISTESIGRHTARASHGNTPTEWEAASRWIAEYMAVIFFGAGRGAGRANGALIAALRAGESFDMVSAAMRGKERGRRNGRKGKCNTKIARQ